MGTLKKIARRTFLVGSAAVVGGIAFGTYVYKRPHENPLAEGLVEGEAAITPFVKIDQSGVTLITPRADKGQGAYSIQAYMLAEELDVDPHKVALSPGKPAPAYYNGALIKEGVPIASYDNGWLAERVRGMLDVPAKMLAIQATGGSSTVPDGFDRMRQAGAVARETLKQAAALRFDLPREQLTTEDGYVILPDGDRVSYSDLAEAAAAIEPIAVETLRPQSQWRYLGKPLQRTDIVAKSTGTQKYGIDLVKEGMVYATVRANPRLGGELVSYDDSKAKQLPGVQRILPISHGVAVVADNTWRAFRAAQAIDVKWGEAAYPASSALMWETLAKVIDGDDYDSRLRNDGDVDDALALQDSQQGVAADVIHAEYRLPYLAHAPLESMNAIVQVNSDSVEIWTGTQIPGFVQEHVAALVGMDKQHVHVYVEAMGGSFGRRLEDTYVLQATEIAMAIPGVPVKMTWSREEDFAHDYPRPMQLTRARGKALDGKIDSFDLSIATSSVFASWMGRLLGAAIPGPDLTMVAGAWDQPFTIPNYRVTAKRAEEMVPISSWRSVGASGNGFVHGSFFDELCQAANIDPLAEMIRLCEDDTSRAVLEKLQAVSAWTGSKLPDNRGRGVAYCLSFGVASAQVVEVTQTPAGIKIDKVYAVVDVGKVLDPINTQAQVFGGVIWGLGHAMNCELTYEDQQVQQHNYHAFEGMRMHQAPVVEVHVLENGPTIRGIGEPGVPPAAPALANAIFAATGQRIRELPLHNHVDFV